MPVEVSLGAIASLTVFAVTLAVWDAFRYWVDCRRHEIDRRHVEMHAAVQDELLSRHNQLEQRVGRVEREYERGKRTTR